MTFKLDLEGERHIVEIVRRRPHLVIRIDGREHEVNEPGSVDSGRHTLEIGGKPLKIARAHTAKSQIIRFGGRTIEVALVDPRSEAVNGGASASQIRAPMPGSVVSIQKSVGDNVTRGETILTIESMKLQTALTAPRDGVIAEILRREGETFDKDEVVVRFEDVAGEGQ